MILISLPIRYEVHNPPKLAAAGFLDRLMAKVRGHEAELVTRLVSKYGPEPAAEAGELGIGSKPS